jgi:hypothetical protein
VLDGLGLRGVRPVGELRQPELVERHAGEHQALRAADLGEPVDPPFVAGHPALHRLVRVDPLER